MTPLELERKAPEGWFSQYDIEVLVPHVEAIPEGGLYLEVGVHKGRSFWVAAQVARDDIQIWGIDIEDDPKIPNTNFIQADSQGYDWTKPIDLLFIDAEHTYEGVAADIATYASYVKPGGVILFHDCDETSPGVVQAANDFVTKNKLTLELFKSEGHNTSIGKVQL